MADARLGSQSNEALSDGTPSKQLGSIETEVLTGQDDTAIPKRLGAISEEVMTGGTPNRQLATVTFEVLVPTRLVHIGWGVPVNHPSWS